jgi:single-strand DNA-binding protein
MGSINRVVLMGLIGNRPEVKISSGGKPYVRLSVATYRRTKDDNGHARRETQWHKVMIWGKNAELCASFCTQGSPIYLEGHLTNYSKEEDGKRSFHVGIVAEQLQLIPGNRTKSNFNISNSELEDLDSLERSQNLDAREELGALPDSYDRTLDRTLN